MKSDCIIETSLKQPVWHVMVLSILTLLGYCPYWFYKTWCKLSNNALYESQPPLRAFKNINPLLRTIGLFVPVLNIYLYLTLVIGIAQLHPNPASLPRRHPYLVAVFIVVLIMSFLFLQALPGAAYLFYLLAVIPLSIMQHWLNLYWESGEPPGLLVRQAFTCKEIVAIILGSLLLGLLIVRFMLGLS